MSRTARRNLLETGPALIHTTIIRRVKTLKNFTFEQLRDKVESSFLPVPLGSEEYKAIVSLNVEVQEVLNTLVKAGGITEVDGDYCVVVGKRGRKKAIVNEASA